MSKFTREALQNVAKALQQTSNVAQKCAIAIGKTEVISEFASKFGNGPNQLHPPTLQAIVAELRDAVAPVRGAGLGTDVYSTKARVTIPGLRPTRRDRRGCVHANSYHGAVIQLACDLYSRLANVALTYWKVDARELDVGTEDFAPHRHPLYRNFPSKKWPLAFTKKIATEIRAADPVIDVGLIQAELNAEAERADERWVADFGKIGQTADEAPTPEGAKSSDKGNESASGEDLAQTPAKADPERPTHEDRPNTVLPTVMSASDLAVHVGRNVKSVSSFLSRLADKLPDCRLEVNDRRRNEPAYLYRTDVVWPAIKRWLERRAKR